MGHERIKLNDERLNVILQQGLAWPARRNVRDLLIQLMSLRITAETYDDEADYQEQIKMIMPLFDKFYPNGEPRLYADFIGMITN